MSADPVKTSPKSSVVITLTSRGVSPSRTLTRPSKRIAFAAEGKGAPTSVTVTSHSPDVPDTALFGGNDNSYAVPSVQTVQHWKRGEGASRIKHGFTLTSHGHTAEIMVSNEKIAGEPMPQDTDHVKR